METAEQNIADIPEQATTIPEPEPEPTQDANPIQQDGMDFGTLKRVGNDLKSGAKTLLTLMNALSQATAVVIMLFGLCLAFFGERLLKPLATGAGFIAGYVVGYKILSLVPNKYTSIVGYRDLILIGLSMLVGLVVAGLFWKLIRVAIFVLGAACGYFLGILILSLGDAIISIPEKNKMLIFAAIIGGILSVVAEKFVLKIVTAVVGSNLAALGLDSLFKIGILSRYNELIEKGHFERMDGKCLSLFFVVAILIAISLSFQLSFKRKNKIYSEVK